MDRFGRQAFALLSCLAASTPAAAADPAPTCAPGAASAFDAPAVGVGIAVGVLNLPKLGAAPTVWLRLAPATTWALELSLDAWLDNDAVLARAERNLWALPAPYVVPFPEGGSRLRFNAFEVGLAVCPYRAPLSPGELALCAGVRGGALRARGIGFTDAVDETRGLLAVEGHARWRYRIAGPVGLTYSAGLFVPMLRDRFLYVDALARGREKFRQAPIGGRLDLAMTCDL